MRELNTAREADDGFGDVSLDRADDRASHLMRGARAKSPGKGSAAVNVHAFITDESRLHDGNTRQGFGGALPIDKPRRGSRRSVGPGEMVDTRLQCRRTVHSLTAKAKVDAPASPWTSRAPTSVALAIAFRPPPALARKVSESIRRHGASCAERLSQRLDSVLRTDGCRQTRWMSWSRLLMPSLVKSR